MNRQLLLLLCLGVVACGCQESPVAQTTLDPVSTQLPISLAIGEKELHEALTTDEILGFVDLVQAFPEARLPEFSPSVEAESVEGLSPARAVELWRTALRETLTPEAFTLNWRPRSAERRVLNEHQVSPKALASVMLRLSCAFAAETIERESSLAGAHRKAEQNITILSHQLKVAAHTRSHNEPALWSALEESTMLAEYLAVLMEVPAESRTLIAQHRQELAAILPSAVQGAPLVEQREDSQIQPISYEAPARPARPSQFVAAPDARPMAPVPRTAEAPAAPQRPAREWKIR